MRIVHEWLREFIDVRKSPEYIADILTMAGLEVDSTEKSNGNTIFDIDLTPNRGDCLSVLGVARELGAISGKRIKLPRFSMPSEDRRSCIKVTIDDRKLCRRYAGRVIKGVTVSESPEWLRKRLEQSDIRPINNVVDITNYVMLEYGQPLHAFDFEKLKVRHIRVALSDSPVKFVTLDGVERRITSGMLLIWDGDTPVAVAGVMGGLESEVSNYTKSIFLESACFHPTSVRRTSSKLGIKSESSLRFERGTDVLNVDRALDRASYLISELAGGLLCKRVDVFPGKHTPRQMKLSYERVNGLLGVELSRTKIQDLLIKIGFQVEEFDDYLIVEVPSYRNDIEKDVDLIEEVARLYGYHKIPSVAPLVEVETSLGEKARRRVNAVKQLFCVRGYSEVINYSFMNPQMISMLRIAQDDPRTRVMEILNPLRQEDSLMRTSLIPSLLENFIYNFNRDIRTIKLFETGNVYYHKSSRKDKLPIEMLRISGICFDEKTHKLWKGDVDDFFVVKGDIDAMVSSLSIRNGLWKRSSEPFVHPGKSADFFLNNEKAGFLGVLSPEIVSELDLRIHRNDIILFEFDLEMLFAGKQVLKAYRNFSRFPHIQRDISVLVDHEKSTQDILQALKSFKSELIDEIEIFDYYKGDNIPEGRVSLAFSITYRSFERTLSDGEVDGVHTDLVDFLTNKTGAELRA